MTISKVIAIDGPSGSGKSTVARLVSKKLGFTYIDTGAMYRGITYKILSNSIDLNDSEKLLQLLENTKFEYIDSALWMDRKLLSDEIRTPEIDMAVSEVASNYYVRLFLTKQQIELGRRNPSVIDGRDAGTVLFPDAILKIFLTADIRIRAERRSKENQSKGIDSSDIGILIEQLEKRDHSDSNRELAPSKKADDAIEIDTGGLSVNDVVDMIEKKYQDRMRELCTTS